MNWFFTALAAGVTSFVATNIDDIIILMLFFSQVNEKFRPRHIIIGQYLGFTVLILATLPGILGGLVIPKMWTGLLGLLPIIIGIKQLLSRENESLEVQAVSDELNQVPNRHPIVAALTKLISTQATNVAAVTVANGGDNISIYIPLFASNNLVSLGVILGIFYILIGVWCAVAYLLTRQPAVAKILTRYGNAISPFVLIGLGIFILIESGSYRLIPLFQ